MSFESLAILDPATWDDEMVRWDLARLLEKRGNLLVERKLDSVLIYRALLGHSKEYIEQTAHSRFCVIRTDANPDLYSDSATFETFKIWTRLVEGKVREHEVSWGYEMSKDRGVCPSPMTLVHWEEALFERGYESREKALKYVSRNHGQQDELVECDGMWLYKRLHTDPKDRLYAVREASFYGKYGVDAGCIPKY